MFGAKYLPLKDFTQFLHNIAISLFDSGEEVKICWREWDKWTLGQISVYVRIVVNLGCYDGKVLLCQVCGMSPITQHHSQVKKE